MTKRDRQSLLTILLKNDCESPDIAVREIATVLDKAIARRTKPLHETITHLRREKKYLVDGKS